MTALTAYLTSTNDTLLTTARQLTNSAPASETSIASGQFAKNGTGWTELYSQGGNATLSTSTEPSASGHGFLWDVTTLEGQQIAAGNWTPTIKLSTGGGTFTATIVVRAFVRSSGGTFTQIGSDMSLSAVSLTSTATAHTFAASSLPAKSFGTGDKLYLDVLLNITTGSSSNTASQRVINLFQNGGASDAVVTPGYTATVNASATTLAAPSRGMASGSASSGATLASSATALRGRASSAVSMGASASAPSTTLRARTQGNAGLDASCSPAGTVLRVRAGTAALTAGAAVTSWAGVRARAAASASSTATTGGSSARARSRASASFAVAPSASPSAAIGRARAAGVATSSSAVSSSGGIGRARVSGPALAVSFAITGFGTARTRTGIPAPSVNQTCAAVSARLVACGGTPVAGVGAGASAHTTAAILRASSSGSVSASCAVTPPGCRAVVGRCSPTASSTARLVAATATLTAAASGLATIGQASVEATVTMADQAVFRVTLTDQPVYTVRLADQPAFSVALADRPAYGITLSDSPVYEVALDDQHV